MTEKSGSEKQVENHSKKHSVKKQISISEKIKKNPWILSTLILGILSITLMFSSFSPVASGVSAEIAGSNFVDYLASRGTTVEYVSSVDYGEDLYEVTVLAQGQEVPAHITKDGKYFVQVVFALDEQEEEVTESPSETESNIIKSDKPEVELFVMSYCPYGTQAEKGIIPAIEALGDDIDFTLRFVYYAMHPTRGEVQENLNQYCIQKEQRDKLLPYLKCFLDKGESESCLVSAGVDKGKLTSCATSTDAEFEVLANLENKADWLNGRFPKFNIDKELNEKYGIGGSPTLVINGAQVSAGRSPKAYMDVICSSFNDSPEECAVELSSETYSPGFGYDATAASGSAATCG